MLQSPSTTDLFLFHLVNRDGGVVLDRLALIASEWWFGISVGIVACGWLVGSLGSRAIRVLAGLALALLLSDGVGHNLLRSLVGRVRPCYSLPPGTFRWLAPAANMGSLPSLHAANLFALALVGTLADRKLALPLYSIAVAVSLSRVYLGVHWPSDVLAGACWGTLCALFSWAVTRRRRASPAASTR
jgi:undecaprenyl-diphosphatase